MRIVISGSRGWRDQSVIHNVIAECKAAAESSGQSLTVVFADAAKGVSPLVRREARRQSVRYQKVHTDWSLGQDAAKVSNQQMLDTHKPSAVYALLSSGKTAETDDLIEQARARGITCHILTEEVTMDIHARIEERALATSNAARTATEAAAVAAIYSVASLVRQEEPESVTIILCDSDQGNYLTVDEVHLADGTISNDYYDEAEVSASWLVPQGLGDSWTGLPFVTDAGSRRSAKYVVDIDKALDAAEQL